MKINVIDTMARYERMYAQPAARREQMFRYELMKPFEPMWTTIQVPLKAAQPGGYDVVMAAGMLGCLDAARDDLGQPAVKTLREQGWPEKAQQVLAQCAAYAGRFGLQVKADEILCGFFLADPDKLRLQRSYTGFGGIPGYIQIIVYPTEYNLPRLPSILAHEFHHNLRFSYTDWDHGNVTLGEYLVIEGLAESFAKEMYGEEQLGPWVTSFDEEELAYSIEVIGERLTMKGFPEVAAYMFGDEIARAQGFPPAGLPECSGYAVGYRAVQSFLARSGMTAAEATTLDSWDIVRECGLF